MELKSMGFGLDEIAKCFNCTAKAIDVVMKRAEIDGLAKYPLRGA